MAKARKTSSKKSTKKSSGGRGSKEAIEKRRVARQLNALLTGGSSKKPKLDGRTEARRKRLVKELKEGKRGKALGPIKVVQHTNDLLEIGETISSLKKQGVKPRKTEINDEIAEIVKRAQSAYEFHPNAWRMLGLRVDAEGEIQKRTRRRTAAKKTRKTTKKKKS